MRSREVLSVVRIATGRADTRDACLREVDWTDGIVAPTPA
jgi:hypothetical protein